MNFKALCAALVLAVAMPTGAQVPSKGAVETHLEVGKIVRAADGRESIVSAETAKPGDTLEYVVTYTNTSSEPVRDFTATLPIPAPTEFIPGSARPAAAKASIDARVFDAMPLKRKVLKDGRNVDEDVALREYHYLRWSVPELGAKKTLTFVARVRVVE